ncbi:hypothetical protein OESDEN_07885 [Oesophagostomum dentatum]|uniref:GST N-terminal domain-containing protein n=2 Tax=Oesophagostomum dentatum TaxID=61180 RepID=A0A0B1T3V8_OESDE|nr:hypothetical protein OESDEN_07885 [Oesophagostomum dentatum]
MESFRVPHFILHDFSDGEESKVIRMILNYAHIPFEVKDIDKDDYILEDYPFYSLPMLEINERKLGNVPSICRQLGWRYELSGQTAGEDSEVDMIAEKTFEARMKIKNWLDHLEHREDHECDKPPGQARYIEVTVSSSVENFSKPMESFRVPHFILHDFSDGEESKVIRMILNYAHIPFEVKDIDKDDYILEDYPFYSLPMLEINERKLGNVPSICRQLGWRYELSGQTAGEDSEVDMIAEKTFEARMKIKNWLDHLEHREDHECDDTCDSDGAVALLESYLLPTLELILRRNTSPWLISTKVGEL